MEKIVGVVLVLLGGYFCGFSGNKPGELEKKAAAIHKAVIPIQIRRCR